MKKIEHYENGDSEFTFEVTMRVGAEDGDGSSVCMGDLMFTIYKNTYNNKFDVITNIFGHDIKLNRNDYDSKADAIEWLIEYVGGSSDGK